MRRRPPEGQHEPEPAEWRPCPPLRTDFGYRVVAELANRTRYRPWRNASRYGERENDISDCRRPVERLENILIVADQRFQPLPLRANRSARVGNDAGSTIVDIG